MVEVGEGVEPDRLRLPCQLDARPQLVWELGGLPYIATNDLVIHGRDPLVVAGGQQKGLSGLPKHPKGRITTSNPALLGCSTSGGVPADHLRSRAHVAQAQPRARRAAADRRGERGELYHGPDSGPQKDFLRRSSIRRSRGSWQDA